MVATGCARRDAGRAVGVAVAVAEGTPVKKDGAALVVGPAVGASDVALWVGVQV
jgi:hypothetical protein